MVALRYRPGNGTVDTGPATVDAAAVRIRILGPVVVLDGGRTLTPRDRVVLAALVVGQGGPVGAERLADALWSGDAPPASRAKVVQGCIVRIRKVLGPDAIVTEGRGYRLALGPDDIDARRFERAVARARELLSLGDPDRAMYAADEALALWRGVPLPELEDWEPGRVEATRLDELHLDVEELRIEAALRAGRHRDVLPDASAAVVRQPLREHRWALLALAQHQAGRQGDALRTLHEARRVLVRELGVDPGDEIVALEAAILRQDPTLVAPRLATTSEICPFRGLSAYEAVDAELFFGRSAEVDECLQRLRAHGVLAIVGPSGSGKSSLLRAGITPALQRAGHRVQVITPGANPLRALAALGDRRTAMSATIVDQCEEAMTLCRSVAERRQFFDALTERAQRELVLVGFRADRVGELTEHPAFAALVERGIYLLTPMSAAQMREAIEAPARQAGLLFEPGLVDLLLREVEDEPGSLPLLSHALYQTWQRRERNVLTVAGYQGAGGIRGAVAQSAEHLYSRVPTDRRAMLRNLMLRLVAPSPDGEPARARVPRRIVAPDAERQRLLDDLVAARLVTTGGEPDGASVELAHESLVRAWPRLQQWLDDDADGQRIWRHLASAAETWDAMGRPDSELYRGVRLGRAMEWSAHAAADLHPVEREFLDRSTRLADDERRALEVEARRQVRLNRRLRVLVAAVTVLSVVAASAATLAFRQVDRVDRQAAVARSHELSAAALAAVVDAPALAKSLAAASVDPRLGTPTTVALAALHQTFAADAAVARWGFVGEVGSVVADVDDQGTRLAAAGRFGVGGTGWTLSVVDVATGRTSWSLDLSRAREASLALAEPVFTADGERVVVGTYWDPSSWRRPPIAIEGVDEPPRGVLGARIHDAVSGALVDRIDLGRCGGVVSAVSTTHLLARTLHGDEDVLTECRWREGTIGVELVELATGVRTVLTTQTDAPWHLGAAMSGDGRLVAYDTVGAVADGPSHAVAIVDVATGAEVRRLATRHVRDLDLDGARLLAGGDEAEVWDVATGEPLAVIGGGPAGRDAESRFASGGRAVVSSSDDGTLRLWDAATGGLITSYPGAGTGAVRAGRSGLVTVSDPAQQIVTVLDTSRRGELGAVELCAGSGGRVRDGALAFVAGRAFVAGTCADPSHTGVKVVDVDGWTVASDARWRGWSVFAAAPDGTALVGQRSDQHRDGAPAPGPVVVTSAATGELVRELAPFPGEVAWPAVSRLRWSPDGRRLAAAAGAQLAVWDARTGELLHVAGDRDSGAPVIDMIFTPDSASVISTSADRDLTHRRLDAWAHARVVPTTVDGGDSIGLVGFADAGATLIAVGGFQAGGNALVRFDADSLVWRDVWPMIHEGAVTSASMSSDGRRVATAANDGTVRVWDTVSGELAHDVGRRSGPVRGVAFVGADELVVVDDGGIVGITIDAEHLVQLVRASLTHGFTDSDCLRFNFGADCPTLGELARRAPDPGTPEGEFRITWSPEELVAAMTSAAAAGYDEPLSDDEDVDHFFRGLAAESAGTYTLRVRGSRFELRRDDAERPVCAGSVRAAPPRLSLLAERGSFCYPSVLFEADVAVDDDGLRVEVGTMRAEFPSMVLFGTRPLQRTG